MGSSQLFGRAVVVALAAITFSIAITEAKAGGIWLVGGGPQSVSVSGFHYDSNTNTFSAAGWQYHPNVNAREIYDIFQAIRGNNDIIQDITPAGNANISGVPLSSKVAKRMVVADILLGDITKGFHYITPLYRLANGYVPVPYTTRPGSQRFEENYLFVPGHFVVVNGVLEAPGPSIKGEDRPVKVQSDGTRSVDAAAVAAGVKDPAIEQNMAHVLANIDYYSKERVIKEMFQYAEIAEFARILKQNGVELDDIWKTPP